jgi:hypothetical protein
MLGITAAYCLWPVSRLLATLLLLQGTVGLLYGFDIGNLIAQLYVVVNQ